MVFRAPGESPTPRSLRSHDRLDRLDRPVQSGLFAVCSPCNRPCKHRLLPCKEERRKEAGKRVIARPHRTAPPGGPEVAEELYTLAHPKRAMRTGGGAARGGARTPMLAVHAVLLVSHAAAASPAASSPAATSTAASSAETQEPSGNAIQQRGHTACSKCPLGACACSGSALDISVLSGSRPTTLRK